MWTFDQGVALGRAIEQIRHHEREIGEVKQSVAEVKSEVGSLKGMVIRAALLLALWAAGGAAHWSAESVGEALGSAIKAMRK